jgi:hypothetical protein
MGIRDFGNKSCSNVELVSTYSGDLNAPDPSTELRNLQWTYAEMLRIEGHWTDQVQNQQRRIAAVLAVNGFLLAFLSTAGLQFDSRHLQGWYYYPFYSCLVLLSLALVFGVVTLFPQIPISGRKEGDNLSNDRRARWIHSTFFSEVPRDVDALWLNAAKIWNEVGDNAGEVNFDRTLRNLCQSIATDMGTLSHTKTMTRRRKWMNWQILLIMLSLVLLMVAIVGQATHVL